MIVRPSGTEPKLKLYLDVQAETRQSADERIAALAAAHARCSTATELTCGGRERPSPRLG